MTRAELELLAIALYESIARAYDGKMPSYLDAPSTTRDDCRTAARQMFTEATAV